jgi:MFS family permease
MLTIGTLIAQAVSGPVAAGFLAMNGIGGLHGWQWLFLLEGLPTVFMSAIVWCYLADSPATATWLTESERKALEADVSRGQAGLWPGGLGLGLGGQVEDACKGSDRGGVLGVRLRMLAKVLTGVVCWGSG